MPPRSPLHCSPPAQAPRRPPTRRPRPRCRRNGRRRCRTTGRLADLTRWWQQFDDPLLTQLVDSAEQASPTLAAAQSRIVQARATRTAAGAALLPQASLEASVLRARQDFVTPLGTLSQAGVQAQWEIDLFGGVRAGRDAAQARLEGAAAGWHDARVSVAADVAASYVALRACEAQVVTRETDTASRGETARLTSLAAQAGFQSPANEAQSRASAAQARTQLAAQRLECDFGVKALVALTAIPEPTLRMQLAAAQARLPEPAQIGVTTVPAQALQQRPDLFVAAREVEAASADVSQAQAQRLPRVTLSGSVSAARFDAAGITGSGTLWSLGPLAVSLPVFDGGTRAANVDAARARYDAAVSAYRGRLRGAVREVEEALVQLQSAAAGEADARIALEGYEASYRAAEARFRGGLSSLFELEDARRTATLAQRQLIDLQRDRVAAWISLYRALGGGWSPAELERQAAATSGARPRSEPHHGLTMNLTRSPSPWLSPAPSPSADGSSRRSARPTTSRPPPPPRPRSPSPRPRRRPRPWRSRSAPTATSPRGRKRASAPRPTGLRLAEVRATWATSSSAARCLRCSRPTRCRPTSTRCAPPWPRPRRASPTAPPMRSARASSRPRAP
jgi:NodT family efflux transporter outer membrane factor (OMF) lipoprotein